MRGNTNTSAGRTFWSVAALTLASGLAGAQGAGPDWRGRYGTACAAWENSPTGWELVVWDTVGVPTVGDAGPSMNTMFACAGWLSTFAVPMVDMTGSDAVIVVELAWTGGGTGQDAKVPLGVSVDYLGTGEWWLADLVEPPEIKLNKSVEGGGTGFYTFATPAHLDVFSVNFMLPFGVTMDRVTIDAGYMTVPVPTPATAALGLLGLGLVAGARRR
jgi:MYXO-CTERM domain-containing protein